MKKRKNRKYRKKKEIVGGFVDYISLCPRGANTLVTSYKSEGSETPLEIRTVTQQMSEEGVLTAAVYVPDLVDAQGEEASAEAIKQLAYSFSRDGRGIDIVHNEAVLPKEDIYMAETFIIQKDDPRFADLKDYDGDPVDATGGWGVVFKVENEALRELYREGEWAGVSLGGLLYKDPVNENENLGVLKSLVKALKELGTSQSENEDINMKPEELLEVLKTNNETLIKGVGELVTKAMAPAKEETKKKEPPKTKKGLGYPEPVLKAGASDIEVAQHCKALNIYQLSQAVDPNNLQEITAFQKAQKAILEDKGPETSDTKKSFYGKMFTNQEGTSEHTNKSSEDAHIDAVLDIIEPAKKKK